MLQQPDVLQRIALDRHEVVVAAHRDRADIAFARERLTALTALRVGARIASSGTAA